MAFNLGSAIGAYFGGMMITSALAGVTSRCRRLSFSAMSALLIYGYLRARQAQANARALA
jgi:DHA1 family arabinose polymer transporter-like MFS transporter